MREVVAVIAEQSAAGRPVAVATVIDVWSSAPLPVGTMMAVLDDGRVVGSVSGGCVESDVVVHAREVLADGAPRRLHYGVTDDRAFEVGLVCGGEIDLLVERIAPDDAVVRDLIASIRADEPVAQAVVVAGDDLGARRVVWPNRTAGTLGSEGLDAAVTADARGAQARGVAGQRHYGRDGGRRRDEVRVLLAPYVPRPRMLLYGATDFAAALSRIGAFLGFHVTVTDVRATFATPARFPAAADVVVAAPRDHLAATEVDERTVVLVGTHDPRFDVPVLTVALRSPAAYVGALGSRSTHRDRLVRLRDAGLADHELARLRSPMGLDLGGRTPEETAVSVAAEIVAERWGGTGRPLRTLEGPIHGPDPHDGTGP